MTINESIKNELKKGNPFKTLAEWYRYIGKKYNAHPERVRKHHRNMNENTNSPSFKGEVVASKDTISFSRKTNFRPRTEEDIYREFEVNKDIWEIEKWNVKTWDAWIKNKNQDIETKEVYSVSAVFKKIKVKENLTLQKQAIIDEISQSSPDFSVVETWDAFRREFQENVVKDNLLLISLFDVHFGKLAHSEETGEDYDIKIAEKRFKAAIDDLVSRVNMDSVERILFPIGNDMFNVDNANRTTTAGTPQDTDTRYFKMLKTVNRIVIESINKLLTFAPVDVLIVPGNHDEYTCLTQGLVLEAYYNDTDLVRVHNSPKLRKYYKYGTVGLQFTHGDKENHQSLGLIFATEEPKLWADTLYRFCMLGHFHKNKKLNFVSVDEHQGFQVQILPSLSGTDKWHASKGYMSKKQAKAFLYNRTKGLVGEFTHNSEQ